MSKKSTPDVRIVILQRGWAMVGKFSRSSTRCYLDNASVIRHWGTTQGLGEIAKGPTEKTKLDPCNGRVKFHELTIIATVQAQWDGWAKHCGGDK